MSELLYTQEQMIRTRNENHAAGIEAERMRLKRLLKRYVTADGKLIWHADKDMTKQEFEQLVDGGEG